jgi:peptide deformylase
MIVTDKEKLRAVCKDVSLFEAQDVISKLENELSKSEIGIGLAANQIGIDAKVCIIKAKKLFALVNPVIVETFDKSLFANEGCLSFPGEFLTTARFNEIVVRDLLHPAGLICTGLEAVVVQHEVGHLYGELMHDFVVDIPAGRNSLCWCGSNRKYKKCCLGKDIK